jgi:hypothetical protein
MPVYVAEIGGRGIAATSVDTLAEAKVYFRNYGPFSNNPHLLESERRLMCQGTADGAHKTSIRVASEDELAIWNDCIIDMFARGLLDRDGDEKGVFVYLVPLSRAEESPAPPELGA